MRIISLKDVEYRNFTTNFLFEDAERVKVEENYFSNVLKIMDTCNEF